MRFLRTLLALAPASLAPWVGVADTSSDPMPGMTGLYGGYPASREASGTSWQPDTTPMTGLHRMDGSWMTMWHGMANFIQDDQRGPRGADKSFSNSWLMFMADRTTDHGAAGARVMISADPLMGSSGYPELFQTGETADGIHPLVDRQHPHNLLMEAAGTFRLTLPANSDAFVYAGIAGEPALGPPAFMHRFSGMDDPEAPLSHHWLDSTHVAYGVTTIGFVHDRLKLDASVFNGREPDQHRYQVELRRLDSYSARLSYNPTPDLSLQVSFGRLASPEQLEPGVAVSRTTASGSYNRMLSAISWQTTLAFGRNAPRAGAGSPSPAAAAGDAWLLESALQWRDVHTLFARGEQVAKDELFQPGQPLYGRTFTVDSLSVGYIRDWASPLRIGVGGLATAYRYPSTLDPSYGLRPVSYLVFVRVRL